MSNETDSNSKYFNLQTTGIGYINRIREVTPKEGNPFHSVSLAALRGNAENVHHTHFECRAASKQAQALIRQLEPMVKAKHKVLVGFTISDLVADTFTFKQGERSGETGVSLKARLIRIAWAKVDGHPFFSEQAA